VYVPTRDPSIMDIASNFGGGCLGALVAACSRPAVEARLRERATADAPAARFLLVLFAFAQWYPFFPLLSRHRLAEQFLSFSHGSLLLVPVWENAATWFACALALRVLLGRLGPVWLAVAMAGLSARLTIEGRSLTLSEVTGVAVAVLLWVATPDALRLRAGLFLIASYILASQLAPFRVSAQPSAFWWVPFSATFQADRSSASIVLARKAFAYGSTLWLLGRSGFGRLWSASLLAGVLLVTEGIQMYLPGRIPESTDAVLVLLMAFILWRLEPALPQRAAGS